MNAIGRFFVSLHTGLLKATDGKMFNMGGRVLVLATIGAKSGKVRENPLMYLEHDGGFIVAASAAGADTNPGWYHNLAKTPEVVVTVKGQAKEMDARIVKGDERDELYAKFVAMDERFAGYAKKTKRSIPIVHLTPSVAGHAAKASGEVEAIAAAAGT